MFFRINVCFFILAALCSTMSCKEVDEPNPDEPKDTATSTGQPQEWSSETGDEWGTGTEDVADECPTQYALVEVNDLLPESERIAWLTGIAESGQICGLSDNGGFIFDTETGEFTLMPTVTEGDGFYTTRVEFCNSDSEAGGTGMYPDPSGHGAYNVPFYWSTDDGMVSLRDVVEDDQVYMPCSVELVMNRTGQTVLRCGNQPERHLVHWDKDSGTTQLPDCLNNGVCGTVEFGALNENNDFMGAMIADQKKFPVIWTGGEYLFPLATFDNERNLSVNDLNIHREAVGAADKDIAEDGDPLFVRRPVLWAADGELIDLGFVEPYDTITGGTAEAINDHGLIVGKDSYHNGNPQLSVGWIYCNGEKRALDTLVEDFGDSSIIHAIDINNAGEIAAQARTPSGAIRPVKLVPLP